MESAVLSQFGEEDLEYDRLPLIFPGPHPMWKRVLENCPTTSKLIFIKE
jgi:hypothetical protein